MNVISQELDRVRRARTETIPLIGELKNRNIILRQENLGLEARIKELKDDIVDLQEEVAEWEAKSGPYDDYEDRAEAVYNFCYDCPLRDSLGCWACYLNKFKEKKRE